MWSFYVPIVYLKTINRTLSLSIRLLRVKRFIVGCACKNAWAARKVRKCAREVRKCAQKKLKCTIQQKKTRFEYIEGKMTVLNKAAGAKKCLSKKEPL